MGGLPGVARRDPVPTRQDFENLIHQQESNERIRELFFRMSRDDQLFTASSFAHAEGFRTNNHQFAAMNPTWGERLITGLNDNSRSRFNELFRHIHHLRQLELALGVVIEAWGNRV